MEKNEKKDQMYLGKEVVVKMSFVERKENNQNYLREEGRSGGCLAKERRTKNDRSVFEEERMTARLDDEVRVSYFCTYILFYI